MKSINKIILNFVKTICDTPHFKISLTLTFLLAIYGGYLSSGFNYIEGFITVLSFPLFFTFGMLLPFLVITFCTCAYFRKNEYLITRLKSKKEYLKILILTVFFVNLFVYIVMLIIIIICLNIFPKIGGIGLKYNEMLNCYNLIYLIFIIIRLFCVIQFISIFSALLSQIIDLKIVAVLNFILYGILNTMSYSNVYPINSISDIPLFIGNYLIVSKYGNFSIEISCTLIFVCILIVSIYLLFLVATKRIGDIKSS